MITKLFNRIMVLMIGVLLLSCEDSASSVDTLNTLTADVPNSVETIIYDMSLPHDGSPHGIPSTYDWALGPRIGMGNNPGNFGAIIAWGQVYEDANGNPAANTRVQIRDIKAYMLSKRDNKWHLIQSSRKVEGAAFREDFADDINKSPDLRQEEDGGISVTAGEGYNFHFWNPARTAIDTTDIAGIFTTVRARLILNNPSQPDDRSNARYLLNMGGDYWLDLMAEWDYWKTNGDIGIGRFKYVTTGWQSFNMISLTEEDIRRNPPPID